MHNILAEVEKKKMEHKKQDESLKVQWLHKRNMKIYRKKVEKPENRETNCELFSVG